MQQWNGAVAMRRGGQFGRQPIPVDLVELKKRIDKRLAVLCVSSTSTPYRMHDAMRYTLLAAGKRLRPMLMLLSVSQCGTSPNRVLDAACAVEMVHAASLILDDLPAMDDAKLRRGKPTTHLVYGEDIAMLASIGLLNRAYAVLAGFDGVMPDIRLAAMKVLTEAVGCNGLLGGQEADLRDQNKMKDQISIDRLNRAKTGVLFEASVEIGGLIAGVSSRELAALKSFAGYLGLALQAMDDVLDSVGTPEQIQKDVGKDKDKTTILRLLGVEQTRLMIAKHIDSACECLNELDTGPEPLAHFVRTAFPNA